MRSKSFRLAAAILSAGGWLLLSVGRLAAQQSPIPPGKPGPSRTKAGYIRFWNAIPPAAGITLDLVVGNTPEGRALTSASPSNYYASYATMAPGSYTLRVFRSGDRQQVIKSFELVVKDRNYFTLLASQPPSGQPTVELIDDTPDLTKAPKNRLTVRQFCQDMTVTVTTSGNFHTEPMPYGTSKTLEGLPDGSIALAVHAVKTGSTAVKTWDAQADFRFSHHSTLFIVNDLYGRMRARAAMDGPTPEEEAEAAAEAKRNTPP